MSSLLGYFSKLDKENTNFFPIFTRCDLAFHLPYTNFNLLHRLKLSCGSENLK